MRARTSGTFPGIAAHAITNAAPARSISIEGRRRRYVGAMLLRTACFVAMVIAPVGLQGKLLLAACAIFLPYIAVVLANTYTRARTPEPQSPAPRALWGSAGRQ